MLFDICVNLLNRQFDDDREGVVANAQAAGVTQWVSVATTLDEAAALQALPAATTGSCTAGIHPHDAKSTLDDPTWTDRLRALAQHPRVKAIGETGLDFNRNFSPADIQRSVFAAQIALSIELQKPLFVHDRESDGEVLRMLNAQQDLQPVVIHCFTGTKSELESYLAAGFYIGITGWIADRRRGDSLREMVAQIPLTRLLLETDAPYLRPHNAPRSRRNEPAMLPYVLDVVAQHRDETRDEIAHQTTANAQHFFGLQTN